MSVLSAKGEGEPGGGGAGEGMYSTSYSRVGQDSVRDKKCPVLEKYAIFQIHGNT
jgi:hypothetical protein